MTAPTGASRAPCVLQVLPALVTGGVERSTIDVAAALHDAGWRAIVVSSGGPMERELERTGAQHIKLPVQSKNPFVIRRNGERLAAIVRSDNVDILHARSRAPAWSAWRAAQQTGTPFVTTFHGTYNLGLPFKRLYNSIMTRGDRVIANSDFIKRHILETYTADGANITVIHRGIDLNIFDPGRVSPERIIQLSTQWRLPDGVPVIMLPGRLTRWKGQTVLLQALAELKDMDFRCLLVGSDQGRTAYTRELQALADKLGLTSSVHIVGDCRDMAAAYKLSDVVVHASTDPEAFGRVIVEAQAMGRPVIAADHGASREMVRAGETGWLAKPGDPPSLAAALRTALTLSSEERSRVADASMTQARERFGKPVMTDKTLAVYRDVLETPRQSSEAAA